LKIRSLERILKRLSPLKKSALKRFFLKGISVPLKSALFQERILKAPGELKHSWALRAQCALPLGAQS
jgi:hypothetical protein